MIVIPDLLTPAQVAQCREALLRAEWIDGRATAGQAASRAKRNLQLPENGPVAQQLSHGILDVLAGHARFRAAALPLKVLPPRFNRYEGGGEYGDHIDSSVMTVPGSGHRIRTDLSATLFFSEPDSYEGGELVLVAAHGEQRVKLPAGSMILYPSTHLHRVTAVTSGMRLAAFFWIQSLVRDENRRQLLRELDEATRALAPQSPDHPALSRLDKIYQDLLRQWAET